MNASFATGLPREALIAIDVGTSGARAAVFGLDGRRHFEIRRRYPTHVPRPGWAEQDARLWQSNALAVLGAAIRTLGSRRRVLAVGLTGQCPSVVGVDASGQPVTPGLIYRDNRAIAEAAALRRRFGSEALHARTGHVPAAFHVGPKILWLRRHRPEDFRRTRWFLQPRDLVGQVLTGEVATDGTHAAATLFLDLHGRRWDESLIDALNLDLGTLPPLRGSWEVLGNLRPSLMRRFGLADAVPIVLGGADSQACALGAGVVSPGPVSEMAGSSTCLNAVVVRPISSLAVTHYTHVVPGVLTTETGINTTGAAVEWLARLLFGGRAGRLSGADFERLDREVGAVEPGAEGVLALPVLGGGERTDPTLRAAFTGVSDRHGRGTLMRAMYEGVAYTIHGQLELLRSCGVPVEELRISGGDARLAAWNQLKADVVGVPVGRVAGDAAVTGIAMLAGMAAGVYRDLADALAQCVHLEAWFYPRPAAQLIYASRYPMWATLYRSSVARRRPDNR